MLPSQQTTEDKRMLTMTDWYKISSIPFTMSLPVQLIVIDEANMLVLLNQLYIPVQDVQEPQRCSFLPEVTLSSMDGHGKALMS